MQNFRTLGLIIKKGRHLLIYLKNACKNIIFPAKFKIENFFTFLNQFCLPPILAHIYIGGFMLNFRTLGLIIKKGHHLLTPRDL